jgi:hypothetical protein
MSSIYKIPCSWEMYGYFECEAENLTDAIRQADKGSLPEGNYVDASFEIDEDIVQQDYPDEEYDIVEALKP